MTQIRIRRQALDEVQKALAQYREYVSTLEEERIIKPLTRKTHLLHSENFVRWMRGEFDPGARNK